MTDSRFFASAKLLLFGEYLVLRGAKALVMPLSLGQKLYVTKGATDGIHWNCFEKGQLWLTILFSPELDIISTNDKEKALLAKKILLFIQQVNPQIEFRQLNFRFEIDFDRHYGFGTSSTFLSLLSQWSGANPYKLLDHSFGGSGFDIAAATASGPFVYQVEQTGGEVKRRVQPASIAPGIRESMLFLYTGKKQKSSEEVSSFKTIITQSDQVQEMNTIVDEMLQCRQLEEVERLIFRSEKLLSGILGVPPVKNTLFPDYPYAVKSLGAWGGDFVMATYRDRAEAEKYFSSKGMNLIFSYDQLAKHE